MKTKIKLAFIALFLLSSPLSYANLITYDANVTNNVIMGSGITNGGFTINTFEGIELGLRAKLRHNSNGDPENTFNSNRDGTYTFDAISAPTQASNVAVWSFEWSINSNVQGQNDKNLDDYEFNIMIDTDPTSNTSFFSFNLFQGYQDHAFGNNSTGQSAGTVAPKDDTVAFAALAANNNLAQNSWKPHWFIPSFDPTLDGEYDIVLTASSLPNSLDSFDTFESRIQVISGLGATNVPEPSSVAIFLLALLRLTSKKIKK